VVTWAYEEIHPVLAVLVLLVGAIHSQTMSKNRNRAVVVDCLAV
jgi:hypothetical protein